jgi:hypothetical protein
MKRIPYLLVTVSMLAAAACESASPVEPEPLRAATSAPRLTESGDDWKRDNDFPRNPVFKTIHITEAPFMEAKFSECTQELINFEGRVRTELRETIDANGTTRTYTKTEIVAFKGVGVSSGRKYTTYQSDATFVKDPVGPAFQTRTETKIDIIRIGEDGNPCKPRSVPDDFRFRLSLRLKIANVMGLPVVVLDEFSSTMTCN